MGLALIENLKRRVIAFDQNVFPYIQNILWDNEAYIVDLNSQDQLFEQGVNRLGVSIMDYAPYTDKTIEIKEAKGQPTNRVTLHDEGDFAGSFFLEVGEKSFEIKAGDWKTEELIKKYGRQILGLTDENISKVIWEFIYPDLLIKAKKVIYGND